MNRLIPCLLLLTIFAVAKGQRTYDEAMRQGDDAFNKQQYKTAINKYFAAEAFDPAKKDAVKAKVDSAFDAIEALRAEAEKAKKDAERANLIANKQEKIALVSQLTAESEIILIKNPSQIEKSVLLALKSMEVDYTPEAEKVLRKSLSLLSRPVFKLSHQGSITDMSISHDNRNLVAANNKTVFVWDIKTGKAIFTAQHDSTVNCVAIDSQSKYLATGCFDGTTVVWELDSKREIYRYQNQAKIQIPMNRGTSPKTARITDLSFSPNGQYLLIANADSSVQLIDIPSANLKFNLKTGLKLNVIKFSPNGEFITGIDNSKIRSGSEIIVWEALTGNKKLHDTIPARVKHLGVDSKGKYKAIAFYNDTIGVWDINPRQKIAEFLISRQSALVDISPDGKFLWATNISGDIYKWDIGSKREVFRIRNGSSVRLLSISSDGQYIATAGSGSVKIWEAQSADPIANVDHRGSDVSNISFSDDEQFLFAQGESINNLIIWNIPAKVKTILTDRRGEIGHGAIISNDGQFLFSTVADSLYKEDWKTKDTLIKVKLEGIDLPNPGSFGLIAFSPNGRYLMKVFNERPLLWQIDTGCHLVNLKLPDDIVTAEFSPSGSFLITVSEDEFSPYVMEIFDLKIKKSIIKKPYPDSFPFFTISYDDKYIALANGKSEKDESTGEKKNEPTTDTAIVMNFRDKTKIVRIKFAGTLNSLAFSPDGKYLLGGQDNGIASVFNIQNRNEVARVDHYGNEGTRVDHQSSVNRVLFSPQQNYIATAGNDGFVRLWLWHREDLVIQACSCISRNFTFDEWKKYFGETPYQLVCKNLPPHPSLREGAKKRARSGDIDGALGVLMLAMKLGDTLKMEPKKWVMQEAAIGVLEQGNELARTGAIKEALESFSKAQKLNPTIKIPAGDWNDLAWQGTIRGQVELVKDAANHALEIEPDNGGFRDTRGVIRALTGDLKGAIEDFEYYIIWGKEKNRRPKQRLDQRQKWIEELKAGRNPFDSKTLEGLITPY